MIGHIGEFAALGTALCWTMSATSFESAGRRVGSVPLNLVRLVMALVLHASLNLLRHGSPVPLDASAHGWFWLAASGLVGFCMGDLCLFRAFVVLGARLAVLMLALVPPITALLGWGFLHEHLSSRDLVGMGITLAGVVWVILERKRSVDGRHERHPASGILLGLGGATGQAVGLILSKFGMRGYDALASTEIRVIAGLAGFAIIFLLAGWWPRVFTAIRDGKAMVQAGIGAFFGPFLGVSLSLVAVQHTASGIAATIMALVPVLIIPVVVFVYGERVSPRAIGGAALAVGGTVVLFLG
jgi:drug/metabolite transporter (DMT)-like permease